MAPASPPRGRCGPRRDDRAPAARRGRRSPPPTARCRSAATRGPPRPAVGDAAELAARALLGTVQNARSGALRRRLREHRLPRVVGAVLAVIGITDAVMRPARLPAVGDLVRVIGRAGARAGSIGPRTAPFDLAFDVLPGFDLRAPRPAGSCRGARSLRRCSPESASTSSPDGSGACVRHLGRGPRWNRRRRRRARPRGGRRRPPDDRDWALTAVAAIGLVVVIMTAQHRPRWSGRRSGPSSPSATIEMSDPMSLRSMPMNRRPTRRSPITLDNHRLARPPGRVHDVPSPTTGWGGVRGARTASERERAARDPVDRRLRRRGPDHEAMGQRPSERFTPDPPTELPLRNSLQLPVDASESMSRLGVRYILLDNGPRSGRVHPGLGRPARRRRERRGVGEPAVDRRGGGLVLDRPRRCRRRSRRPPRAGRSAVGDRPRERP